MPGEREPHLHSNGFITGRIGRNLRRHFGKKQSRFVARGRNLDRRGRVPDGGSIDPSIYDMENSYTTGWTNSSGIKDRICRRMEEAAMDNRVTKTISFDNRIFRAVALLTIDQSFESTSRRTIRSARRVKKKRTGKYDPLRIIHSSERNEKKNRVTNTSNNLVGRQSGIRR